jgi:hypothetical protein
MMPRRLQEAASEAQRQGYIGKCEESQLLEELL